MAAYVLVKALEYSQCYCCLVVWVLVGTSLEFVLVEFSLMLSLYPVFAVMSMLGPFGDWFDLALTSNFFIVDVS